ncbi:MULTISPECIES: UpxY family transcription antiterminator [Pseudoalteromonas]|uniref:UpxY family transcription antiterminator n=1 Tax=Pseudoalteromonas obscura TaxID=3048491 RepID=A0ABT7EEV4_9GAMM|nr:MULTISPECIES: UpxY family transcription antiterminator [Pseudoalteromonas]MBQ4839577.1 UpxY family transcription antiterminator [Pseudoalteromonas luteoviolacea]MDK2593814.1 UpxY family transcription antiterminator [Pseudoalteromonas sp. P94(2023)]
MTTIRNWYVVYTKPNTEKKFTEQVSCIKSGCDVFLPLQVEKKQWSDRVKSVNTPLFKSYVFVYVDDFEYHHIKRLNGFVDYIKFNGKPSIVSPTEVAKIKAVIASGYRCEPVPNQLTVGCLAEIKVGALKGYQGKLLEYKNDSVFAIEIQGLDQSLLMSVPQDMLQIVEAS